MALLQNLTPPPTLPRPRFKYQRVAGQDLAIPEKDWLEQLTTNLQTLTTAIHNTVSQSGVNKGPEIVSATTITVSHELHDVSGSTNISTINAPASAGGGFVYLHNTGSWQFVGGGNIATPYIPGTGEIVTIVYDATTQRWYVPGQPSSGGGGGGTAGPPTNDPVPDSFNNSNNTDGSVNYTIGWTYSQGANQATGFLVYVKLGNGTPSTTDFGFDVGLAQQASFDGFPSDVEYSFGVAAYRTADGQTIANAIQSSTSTPNWQGVTSGTPDWLGNIQGQSAATIIANASDGAVGFEETVRYRSTGAPSANVTPDSFSHVAETDGSISYTIGWTYVQGALQADGYIVFWKTGDTGSFDPITDAHYVIGSTEQTVTNGADFFEFDSSASYAATGGGTWTWDTANSQLTFTAVSASTLTRTGVSFADIAVSATFTRAESSRLLLRFADANNYYYVRIEDDSSSAGNANTVRLFKLVAGVSTGLAAAAPISFTRGDSHLFKFQVIGTDLTVEMDGVVVTSASDSALSAAGLLGVGSAPTAIVSAISDFAWGTLDSRIFTLRGIPSDRTLSFGVAAFRKTENSLEIGTIISSASAPDWEGVNQGTPNYTGNTFGVPLHNWTLTAAGNAVSQALVGYADAPTNTISNIGVVRDTERLSWEFADVEYAVLGSSFAYGRAYNLLLYDLVSETVLYAHCYDTVGFGTAVTNADLFTPITTGTGTTQVAQPGQFGNAIGTNGIDSSNRAYWRTNAASTVYGTLARVSVWFKKAAHPAAQSTVVGLNETATADSGYRVPVIAINTNGTVSCQLWNGSAFVAITGTVDVCDGNWHQINVRLNGTNFRLFIDGTQDATVNSALTTFTTSPPGGGLYIHLGAGNGSASGDLFGQAFYDELAVADTPSGIDNTLQPVELSDYLAGTAGTFAMWHFQEVGSVYGMCNARKAPRALTILLTTYKDAALAADSIRYLVCLAGNYEPAANRTVDSLPVAIADAGGTKFLFTSGSFQTGSAYALVGQPGIGEGQGLEGYVGTAANATDAVVKLSFQTMGSRISARSGVGWIPALIPGGPTNAPTTLGITATTSDTGQRQHKLTWAYTQPALSGTNAPADGFILYYQKANTSNPTEQFIKLDINALAYTFEWSLPAGSVVSYAIAAYRKTTSGIEVGAKTTTGVWQNVTASLYVQSLEPGAPTNSPTTLGITNTTIATGERTHKLTWAYTQSTFAADGFVLYYEKANTSNPAEQQIYLNNDVRAFTFEWSLASGSVVSYAITAFRRTINGIEETSKVTTGVWQNVPADQVVQNTGIGVGQVEGSGGGGTNNISGGTVQGTGGGGDLDTSTVGTGNMVDSSITTPKRQAFNTQFTSTGTIVANTGSSPVIFDETTVSFSWSLAHTPLMTIEVSGANRGAPSVITIGTSGASVSVTNLRDTDFDFDVIVDYW